MPVTQLASRLTPRAWLIAGGAAAAAILFIYIFIHTASQPSYTILLSGVNPAQTSKMESTLSAHGISYQLQNNGTAIAVQSNQASSARVALAGANQLGGTQPGLELFDKQNLGESNFQQAVTYQRALQGQLEQTINSVQGVSGAQVELVLPDPQSQVFGETQGSSSAAVLLSGTGSLDPGSVRGIAQLVASSVRGLQLSKVTITDASGQLLWPQAGGSSGGGSSASVQEAEQRYDQSMAASLNAMLAQTVGVGKAQVLVYANMNVNQTTQESLTYGKAGVPQHTSKSLETLAGSSGGGGATGTANVGTGATAGKSGNYKKETSESSLAVSKTVTHSTVAPGVVESQHVSVLLDKSVPAASLPAITEAVTNAAGVQTKRGDTISIGQVAFPKSTTAAPAGAASSPLGMAKYALLGIGALLFLFFTTRSLRKRETEPIEEPVWLRELEAPVRLSELESQMSARGSAPITAGVGPAGSNGAGNGRSGGDTDDIRRQVEQLADEDPDLVAQQLRTWMQED